MPISFVFWLLWVIWIVFRGWGYYPSRPGFPIFGGELLLIILMGLLGWHVFGFVIRG